MRWFLLLALVAAGIGLLVLSLGSGGERPHPLGLGPGVAPPKVEPGGTDSPAGVERVEPDLVGSGSSHRTEAARPTSGSIELTVVREDHTPVSFANVFFFDCSRHDGWQDLWNVPREREAHIRRFGVQSRTDQRGRTVLAGTDHGAVSCNAAGLLGFLEWKEYPEDGKLEIVLAPERSLVVEVVDHRGRPQGGVRVGIMRRGGGQTMTLLTRQTDPQGRATFGLVRRVLGARSSRDAHFFVSFAFPCDDPPKVDLDPDDLPVKPIRLQMPLVGRIELRVLDERSQPLREVANVSLGRMTLTQAGERIFQPDHNERLMSGHATFTHVGVGTRIAIKLSGSRERADLVAEFDGPSHSGEARRIDMRWTDRYPVLLGTAVGEGGELLKGFRGRYMVWSEGRGSGGPPLTTGPDGGFRVVIASSLAAQSGRYAELELYARDPYGPQYARIDLSGALLPGETDLGPITFRPKPKLVSGVVRDSAGKGLAGVHVRVLLGKGADSLSTSMAATSLQEGRFTIYGEVDGEFNLVAVRRGYKNAHAEGVRQGTEGLVLTLLPDLPQRR